MLRINALFSNCNNYQLYKFRRLILITDQSHLYYNKILEYLIIKETIDLFNRWGHTIESGYHNNLP